MKKVYIAGKLNGMAVEYLQNCHKMIKAGIEIKKRGFSVYIPCLDILCGLMKGDWEYEDYFLNSQPWLEVSNAMYLVPGWQKSKGTKREIEKARSLGIPIYEDINELEKEIK